FSEKTKLILLNSPHNPSSKVFDVNDLRFIADLVERFDAYAVCDEVYEHLTFDGRGHTPLMTLPGMRNRCVRIGSAGKTFSMTGWKVGYITACADLLMPIAKAHQFVTFTTPPNLQKGVAHGLGLDDAYFTGLAGDMQAKRDRLGDGLRAAGFKTLESGGSYFLTVDYSPLGFTDGDEAFCRHITTEAGVTAVPLSAFYQKDGPRTFVRFCFSKRDEILDEAVARLRRHFGG
ncbi:MAG: aminotransferase class I/II-fold pyridoxal phosphate-dependent enzyme, partial [Rhodospirillales bacterium]|nr:aminotransferase class I/II-fold pyridoxal phosphate-dependent enzyme [Rhodospirillales bacterium]